MASIVMLAINQNAIVVSHKIVRNVDDTKFRTELNEFKKVHPGLLVTFLDDREIQFYQRELDRPDST